MSLPGMGEVERSCRCAPARSGGRNVRSGCRDAPRTRPPGEPNAQRVGHRSGRRCVAVLPTLCAHRRQRRYCVHLAAPMTVLLDSLAAAADDLSDLQRPFAPVGGLAVSLRAEPRSPAMPISSCPLAQTTSLSQQSTTYSLAGTSSRSLWSSRLSVGSRPRAFARACPAVSLSTFCSRPAALNQRSPKPPKY